MVPEFEYNGKASKAAKHDLGAASALLTVEATARGLCVHQMIGIDGDAAAATFELAGKARPLTALTIGYAGLNPELPAEYLEREQAPRQRKPLADLLLGGSFSGLLASG